MFGKFLMRVVGSNVKYYIGIIHIAVALTAFINVRAHLDRYFIFDVMSARYQYYSSDSMRDDGRRSRLIEFD